MSKDPCWYCLGACHISGCEEVEGRLVTTVGPCPGCNGTGKYIQTKKIEPSNNAQIMDACVAAMERRPEEQTVELTQKEVDELTEKHHEQVMCSACKEWTEFGESCCGKTECSEECPVCNDANGIKWRLVS